MVTMAAMAVAMVVSMAMATMGMARRVSSAIVGR